MFKIIVKLILSKKDTFARALKLSPFFIGMTFFVVVLSFLFKTPLGKKLVVGHSGCIAGCIYSVNFIRIRRDDLLKGLLKDGNRSRGIFQRIQVGTACYVALAQGANDVANAIGPLAVIYFLVKTGSVGAKVPVPVFLLCLAVSELPVASPWPVTVSWKPWVKKLPH